MSESIRRAITSLGQIEDRLRKALGLVGEVGFAFDPSKATPVIVVADAMRPGTATQAGRRFGFMYTSSSVAVNTDVKFRFASKVVITRLRVTFTALTSNPPVIRLVPPGTADPTATYAALTSTQAAWREGTFASDGPPVEQATNGTLNLGRVSATCGNNTGPAWDFLDYGVEAGGVLIVGCTATVTNLAVSLEGYIF